MGQSQVTSQTTIQVSDDGPGAIFKPTYSSLPDLSYLINNDSQHMELIYEVNLHFLIIQSPADCLVEEYQSNVYKFANFIVRLY